MRSRHTEAGRELTTALRLALEVGNPPQLWKTWAALGALQQAQGDAGEAGASYQQALAVIDGVAAGLQDAQLRQTFLDSPEVQRIRDVAPMRVALSEMAEAVAMAEGRAMSPEHAVASALTQEEPEPVDGAEASSPRRQPLPGG